MVAVARGNLTTSSSQLNEWELSVLLHERQCDAVAVGVEECYEDVQGVHPVVVKVFESLFIVVSALSLEGPCAVMQETAGWVKERSSTMAEIYTASLAMFCRRMERRLPQLSLPPPVKQHLYC